MTPIALILLISSTFLHAAWNLIAKGNGKNNFETFKIAIIAGSFLLLPVMLVNVKIFSYLDLKSIVIILIAGFFQFLYYYSLNRSYSKGDLSLVYPVVRAVPVILVAFIRVFAFGAELNALVIAGIILIMAGCLVIPFSRLNRENLGRFAHTFHIFVIITIIGTTGYTLVDDLGLRHFTQIMPETPAYLRSICYLFLENLSSLIWMFLFTSNNGNASLYREKKSLVNGMKMGFGITITYLLVLISMNYVSDVSYVAAMRQLSIPIGVIVGFVVLKEPRYFPRILGMILIFGGLLAVSL